MTMSIHDTPAYCSRCGGNHVGRKGAHCKVGPTQPGAMMGTQLKHFAGPQSVNEFAGNGFAAGRADGRASR